MVNFPYPLLQTMGQYTSLTLYCQQLENKLPSTSTTNSWTVNFPHPLLQTVGHKNIPYPLLPKVGN